MSLMPEACCTRTMVRCPRLPLPTEPMLTLPGFALASATTSVKVL